MLIQRQTTCKVSTVHHTNIKQLVVITYFIHEHCLTMSDTTPIHYMAFTLTVTAYLLIMSASCNAQPETESTNNNCTDGYYGNTCQFPCNCYDDVACNTTNGDCPAGKCKQWFTSNPKLGENNCNAEIVKIKLSGRTQIQTNTTWITVKLPMTISEEQAYLDQHYFYTVHCKEQPSGVVKAVRQVGRNSTADHLAATFTSLKMLTSYILEVEIFRQHNGIQEQSQKATYKTRTLCDKPTSTQLHYKTWPEQSVYFHWNPTEIRSGCQKAQVKSLKLFVIKRSTGRKRELKTLRIGVNHTVVTHLAVGTYDFLLRVKNTVDSSVEGPPLTVIIPEIGDSVVTQDANDSHHVTWTVITVLLCICLTASICFIVFVMFIRKTATWTNFTKKRGVFRVNEMRVSEDGEKTTQGNVQQSLLAAKRQQSTESSNSQHYTALIREEESGDNYTAMQPGGGTTEGESDKLRNNKVSPPYENVTREAYYENVNVSGKQPPQTKKKLSKKLKVGKSTKNDGGKQRESNGTKPPIATKPKLKDTFSV